MSKILAILAALLLGQVAFADSNLLEESDYREMQGIVQLAKCTMVSQETSMVGGAVGGVAGGGLGALAGGLIAGDAGAWIGGLAGGATGSAIGSRGQKTYQCKLVVDVDGEKALLETLSETEYRKGESLTVVKLGKQWSVF